MESRVRCLWWLLLSEKALSVRHVHTSSHPLPAKHIAPIKTGLGTPLPVPCVRLLHPDRITTADGAALHYGSIHTDVDLVMLGHRAQDARITSRDLPARAWSSRNARTDR